MFQTILYTVAGLVTYDLMKRFFQVLFMFSKRSDYGAIRNSREREEFGPQVAVRFQPDDFNDSHSALDHLPYADDSIAGLSNSRNQNI
jgi:hypothetical protein